MPRVAVWLSVAAFRRAALGAPGGSTWNYGLRQSVVMGFEPDHFLILAW
jgi:hypothetical protein